MKEVHENVLNILKFTRQANDNLYFTLRETNRYGRLDKGYWFLGTDDYLAVSFWTGINRLNKTPNIYLNIDKKRKCQIILNAKSSGVRAKFLKEYIWPLLIKEINPKREDLWHKFETNSGVINLGQYEDAIAYFLRNIKDKIDKQIVQFEADIDSQRQSAKEFDNYNEFEEPNDEDLIRPIHPFEFEKQLKRINIYKSYLKDREIPKYLNAIEIKSFGLIKNIIVEDIPKKCRWIFLTGENGAGKSTILKALTVGLNGNLDCDKGIIKDEDNGKFSIRLKYCDSNNNYLKQTIKWNDDKNKALPKPWKGFAGYGAIRLSEEDDSCKMFKNEIIDSALKKDCYNIFNSIGILHKIESDWLFQSSDYDEIVIHEHLKSIISTIYKINQGVLEDMQFLENDNNSMPMKDAVSFNQLPSGTRSLVALIVDLFIRLNKQQPGIDDPSKYTGIVLIDEIDIHLHPKMQKEIVEQLGATFPNIQFIVTTHSPIPILGAPENSVFLTVKKEYDKGIYIERWDNKIPVKKLLPNALLTSPIFDLDNFLPVDESLKDIRTEDKFEDAFFNYMLQKEVDKLKRED
jgi:predicted ATPase